MTSTIVSEYPRRSAQREATPVVRAGGFHASEQLTRALQAVLVELVELSLQGKQAHWNLQGHNFRDIHLALDEIVDAARQYSDDVAERMRALFAVPDARTETVVEQTAQPGFPFGEITVARTVDVITERLDITAAVIREVHDRVDAEDPTSADILHTILEDLEKKAWMLRSENR